MSELLLILLSAAMAGISRLPLHTGWLAFVAYIPLLYYFAKSDRMQRGYGTLLKHAFIYSAVNISLWMHWIWGVTSPGFVGIILLFALYYFVLFIVLRLLWVKLPRLRYVSFVVLFICLEYLQNFGDWCFPWTNIGYALADYTVLIQAADIGGVSMLSMLILIINVLLYLWVQKSTLPGNTRIRTKLPYALGVVAIIVLWAGYGTWCLRSIKLEEKPSRIALMQPSIPQDEKWETNNFDQLYNIYRDLTRKAALDSADLIIYPEAAMPVYLLHDNASRSLIQNLCNAYDIEIFTGFPEALPAPPDYPGQGYYYNAATLFKPDAQNDIPYYKMILVPVGERIPWLNVFPILWKLQFGQANWEYGKAVHYYDSKGLVFAPQICFEIAFPELNQRMAYRDYLPGGRSPAQKIDFLVNITNDAWFGKSSGPWIHAMLTKFRAVENRIQIYRSANTGISMAVDPLGRIIQRTKLFEVTQFQVPLYTTQRVPLYYYVSGWERILCLLAVILIIVAMFTRKPVAKPSR